MGLQDPLGDALTSSMARVILSRQPLPGDCNARARSSGVARKALGDRANTADAATVGVGRTRKPRDGATVALSRPTKAFLDRHPLFVNGEGVEVAVPRFVDGGASAPGAGENRAPRERAEHLSPARRVVEGRQRSKELWKKINPGYVGSGTDWHQSEYARELALTAAKLETAKFGARDAFKHHLAKTDTSVYVEAVAKERIFAKAAALEAARELERLGALAAAGSVRSGSVKSAPGSSAGDAPPAAEPAANATPPPEPNAEGSGK